MSVATKESFDRVFTYVGSNGPFQFTLLLITSLQGVILSWQHLSYVFLGAVPNHFCRISELTMTNWTLEEIRNISTPMKTNGNGWESCSYYDLNYTKLATMRYEDAWGKMQNEYEDFSSIETKQCDQGWIFDTSVYESTLVTEFQLVCDKRYLVATIQATYMCGVFVGSLTLGSLSDRLIGRRKAVLISVILTIVGGISVVFATSYWQLIVFRFFVAFGVAGAYQNCYVLLMEYTGTESRSTMGMIQQLPYALGYMLMAVFAYFIRDWQTLQCAFSASSVILLAYFWILPESARWLAVSGRSESSLIYLMKVARKNKKVAITAGIQENLYDIILSCSNTKPKRAATFTISDVPDRSRTTCVESLIKIWQPIKKTLLVYYSLVATPEMRKRSLLLWLLFIAVDLVYFGVVFDSATLSTDPYLVVFLGGLTEVPAYTIFVPALSRWGRRPTIVLTLFSTAICTLAVAYINVEQELARMVTSMCGKLFITTSFAVIYLLGTELYPTATRSTGLAAAIFMGRIGSILAPYVVDGTKHVYTDMPNIIFGIVCLVAGTLAISVPETNNLEMADQLCDVEDQKTVALPPLRKSQSLNSQLEIAREERSSLPDTTSSL